MANTELVVTNQERYFRVVAESLLTSLAQCAAAAKTDQTMGINRKSIKNKIMGFILPLQNLGAGLVSVPQDACREFKEGL